MPVKHTVVTIGRVRQYGMRREDSKHISLDYVFFELALANATNGLVRGRSRLPLALSYSCP
jgi:hypothetical protein